MTSYRCISCGKLILAEDVKRRVRCKWCGKKILYKPKTIGTTIEAN